MKGVDYIHTGRTAKPVPRRDMEREKSVGTSPAVSRVLNPEELAEVIRIYGAPLRSLPKRPHRQMWTETGQGLEYQKKQGEKPGRKGVPEPDKKMVLTRIAASETIKSIESSLGFNRGQLYTWIKKWGLVGITPGMAKQILDQR
jgi:hypothetical protein